MGTLEKELQNEFSIKAIDITSPLVTFLNDGNVGTGLNQFNFSSGWNYEMLTTNYNGDGHWTTQVGATVTINFVATEFAIVAIKDPGHGIMTISIDGGNAIDIDLYSNVRIGKQMVYESGVLSSTQHNVIIKCSGRKNTSSNGIAAFIDGIFILNKTNSSIIPSFGALPTNEQIKYQKEELTAFIHFGVNTFTDREWGTGTESPSIFNPSALDTDQWIKPLADAGFGRAILTAKHHDGFCLWNSAYTSHDVGSSPWMGGKGDVVKAMSQSCAKYGIKFGIYLSPWDENSPLYGTGDAYNKYYMDQLKELFANYGKIAEVWMDGAKGSNVQQDYKFDEWFNLIKSLDPECEIFSPQGPDIRWIGNENGYAGEPCWSTISREKMKQQEIPTYLNTGEEGGPNWIVGEADVSIRPGWFYHSSQDNSVKSLSKLIDIYFNSVGRNAQLLLNIPPDKRGLVHENDVNRLKEFGDAIKLTFQNNLALNKSVTTDSVYNDLADFNGSKILDG
ncbi:MAG: alpha-L-fucosidase, partial [Sarcina sp.]